MGWNLSETTGRSQAAGSSESGWSSAKMGMERERGFGGLALPYSGPALPCSPSFFQVGEEAAGSHHKPAYLLFYW